MCFLPAFPPKAKPAPAAPQREWEAGLAFLHSTRRELDDAGRSEQVVLALADGAYDTLNFWRGLPVIAPCWLSAPHGIDACIICPSAPVGQGVLPVTGRSRPILVNGYIGA